MGLFTANYAQASNQKSLTEVKTLVQNQTGYETSSSKKDDIQKEMEEFLNQPLTEDKAVKIAILNSPLIKAELSSLGISEAGMRETGLLHNPTVKFSSRKSNEKGVKQNNEIEIKQDVLDVLFWPLRSNAAGARFKASQYDAANRIAQFVKEVRLSYFEWVASEHKKALAQDHFKAQETALEIAHRQKQAGNINTLQMVAAQAVFQKAKIEWLKTQQDVEMLSQRLRTILSLGPDQFFMNESSPIRDLPKETLVLKELEKQALDHRLDLLMKRQEIKGLEQSLNLANFGFFQGVEVGYDQETETSGNKLKGIVIEGQVPLFNRNQASRFGIRSSIEMSKHLLDAMEQQVLLEVRLAYQNLMTSRQVVEAYKETVPLYSQMVKETLYHYNFMLTDVFHLLQAKQAELETKKEYVDALKGYWASRVELEYAVGAKLLYESVQSSVVKKDDQPKTMTHEHNHGG